MLDGVAETYALMRGLRSAAQDVEQATRLADLLVAQFPVFATDEHDRRSGARSNQQFILAEDLRRRIAGAARSLGPVVDQMDRELRQLREAAERLRLVAADSLFTALERMARDTARRPVQTVVFKATGGDIQLDAHVLATLQGALVQIVRNAVAHGIETEDERRKAGKSPAGAVSVAVVRRDRRIVFSCSDDGRGVDLDAVRRIASQRGVIEASAKNISSDDLVRLLLRGGISTSQTITEVSGRGIGLDIVRESVERLGGEVVFRSVPGRGTTFELVIPPSLASIDALIVETRRREHDRAFHSTQCEARDGFPPMKYRSPRPVRRSCMTRRPIAFAPLSTALDGTPWPTGRSWTAVVVAGVDGMAAIGVERLLGTASIVVRPLPRQMTATPIVSAVYARRRRQSAACP